MVALLRNRQLPASMEWMEPLVAFLLVYGLTQPAVSEKGGRPSHKAVAAAAKKHSLSPVLQETVGAPGPGYGWLGSKTH